MTIFCRKMNTSGNISAVKTYICLLKLQNQNKMSASEDSLVVSLLLDERSELRLNRKEEVVNELLDGVFASSSSSEDSEGETEDHPKCNNFEATLDAMGGSDFKMHMRLKRVTVEYLINNIQKFIEITT
ncbi:PREDICTED: uncharacterized protein LOC108361658 [Rhagoletis zephyria]|uniref:uncharacterized protein LOC108361658 n=1 Tax=Rhagoletis zephyria TaxID=28612 RepID=UPI0008112612|nr:PREDICTED: uncharacterized protein LOC108361658 [Rhagoletis zephyria]XP_017469833.1 PREDICTED: uncharacterized protein LOC108361658 [Rhagoletis zephyria]